jgi:hypothetical protein
MTPPPDRVADALARLVALAQCDPADESPPAARRVVGVLRRTGCFDAPRFPDESHMPDCCPLATWIRLETGLAAYVSGGVMPGSGRREPEPGRAILLGALVPGAELPREPGAVGRRYGPDVREVSSVVLPAVVTAAVRLIDRGFGVADQEAA